MKIVVLLKEVPDTWGDRTLDLETGLAARDASERVLDEIGERALEAALTYSEANEGTEVVVMTMASDAAVLARYLWMTQPVLMLAIGDRLETEIAERRAADAAFR